MRKLADVPPFERGVSWRKWFTTEESDGITPLDKIITRSKAAAGLREAAQRATMTTQERHEPRQQMLAERKAA